MFRYIDVSEYTPYPSAGGRRTVSRMGICLHSTGGVNSLSWLQREEPDPKKRSSADYLINEGGDIFQVSRINMYAHHAGQARWRSFDNEAGYINMLLVGIEVECLDTPDSRWTDPQYIALGALMRRLFMAHRMPLDGITEHRLIARPLGRKTDPLALSWPVLTREFIHPSREASVYAFPEVLP